MPSDPAITVYFPPILAAKYPTGITWLQAQFGNAALLQCRWFQKLDIEMLIEEIEECK